MIDRAQFENKGRGDGIAACELTNVTSVKLMMNSLREFDYSAVLLLQNDRNFHFAHSDKLRSEVLRYRSLDTTIQMSDRPKC